jgi:hypothetical protein
MIYHISMVFQQAIYELLRVRMTVPSRVQSALPVRVHSPKWPVIIHGKMFRGQEILVPRPNYEDII